MPSAMVIFAAYHQLLSTAEGAALLAGVDPTRARAEAERACQAKRALEPMVGEQVVEEVDPSNRRLVLPSGKVIEIERFE